MHSTNTDPSSLHPSRVAPKNEVRRNSQATKADPECRDALNRQLVNVHDSNVAPLLVHSVRSTSRKVQSRKTRPVRSSPYQSSSL